MSDNISLPRAVVEALVDPNEQPYMVHGYVFQECVHCLFAPERGDMEHESDCPVRIAQEALSATPRP